MPFAATLRLDDAAAAPVLAMLRALAESSVESVRFRAVVVLRRLSLG